MAWNASRSPPTTSRAWCEVARERAVDLVVVRPEAPLVAGVVDELTAAGLTAFKPERRRGPARGLQGPPSA